jgi:hypothetical protein
LIDSQSVKGADTVGRESRVYEASKKVNGRKRFIVSDTLGLLLTVVVLTAGVQGRDGANPSCSTPGCAPESGSSRYGSTRRRSVTVSKLWRTANGENPAETGGRVRLTDLRQAGRNRRRPGARTTNAVTRVRVRSEGIDMRAKWVSGALAPATTVLQRQEASSRRKGGKKDTRLRANVAIGN